MKNITMLTRNAQAYLKDPNDDIGQAARSDIEDMVSLFSGSGFEDTEFDFAASKPNKLILTGSYHKMNEGGYYDGYAHWKAIIRPDIMEGFSCSVTTRNADSLLKEYLWESIHNFLTEKNRQEQGEDEKPRRDTEIGRLCNRIIARQNCFMSGNETWLYKHDENIKAQLRRMEEDTGLHALQAQYDRAKGTVTFSGRYEYAERAYHFCSKVRPDFRTDTGFAVKTSTTEPLSTARKALISASIAQYCAKPYEEPKEDAAPGMTM